MFDSDPTHQESCKLCSCLWPAVGEIMRFLFHQKIRAMTYTRLFLPAEAKANNLPCLMNRQPKNLMLWAKIRFYMQVGLKYLH